GDAVSDSARHFSLLRVPQRSDRAPGAPEADPNNFSSEHRRPGESASNYPRKSRMRPNLDVGRYVVMTVWIQALTGAAGRHQARPVTQRPPPAFRAPPPPPASPASPRAPAPSPSRPDHPGGYLHVRARGRARGRAPWIAYAVGSPSACLTAACSMLWGKRLLQEGD